MKLNRPAGKMCFEHFLMRKHSGHANVWLPTVGWEVGNHEPATRHPSYPMRDVILIVLFVLIVLVGLFALAYPWTFKEPSDRILMHQPLLMLILFALYELATPPATNIRIDWLFLFPLLSLVLVAYAIKLWLSNR